MTEKQKGQVQGVDINDSIKGVRGFDKSPSYIHLKTGRGCNQRQIRGFRRCGVCTRENLEND